MKTKTKKIGAMSAATMTLTLGSLLLTSCQKEELPTDPQEQVNSADAQSLEEGGAIPTDLEASEPILQYGSIDESTGHEQASDDGRSVTCSISPTSTVWSTTDGIFHVNEAQRELPAGYFMTGVGLTVTDNNVVTLMVRGRPLLSTCTWGSQLEYRAGTNPYGGLEKSFTVPAGYAITGVRWGVHDSNVNRLVVKYRALQQQADGSRRLGSTQYTYDSGGTIVESSLQISDFGYAYNQYLFSGFGAECFDSNARQSWAKVRRINP